MTAQEVDEYLDSAPQDKAKCAKLTPQQVGVYMESRREGKEKCDDPVKNGEEIGIRIITIRYIC